MRKAAIYVIAVLALLVAIATFVEAKKEELFSYYPLDEALIDQALVIGATYQLDRARFGNGKVVICTSEKTMDKYNEAERNDDQATMKAMIVDSNKLADNIIKRAKAESKRWAEVKVDECCITISSSSQATILEKGISAHKAKFAAWSFRPMWAYYMAFGGKVR